MWWELLLIVIGFVGFALFMYIAHRSMIRVRQARIYVAATGKWPTSRQEIDDWVKSPEGKKALDQY
jgi:hypothetical protein